MVVSRPHDMQSGGVGAHAPLLMEFICSLPLRLCLEGIPLSFAATVFLVGAVARNIFHQFYLVRSLRHFLSHLDLATSFHALITLRLGYCN